MELLQPQACGRGSERQKISSDHVRAVLKSVPEVPGLHDNTSALAESAQHTLDQ